MRAARPAPANPGNDTVVPPETFWEVLGTDELNQDQAAEPALFPLPGTDEALEEVMLPLIPGLIHALHDAMRDSSQGMELRRTILIQEATGRLAGKAEVFGLHKLSKMARCVERAAEADDLMAVQSLMGDLFAVCQRYLAALQECYRSFIHTDR